MEHDAEHTLIHVEIPGFYVEDVYEESEWFKRIYVPDTGTTDFIGRPELPVLRDLVALLDDFEIDVDVYGSNYETFENYHIYPLQPSYQEDPEFYYDEKFYQTDEYYPLEEAGEGLQGIFKDFYAFWSTENAFRYIPADDVMKVNYKFKVEYTYSEKLEGKGEYWVEKGPIVNARTEDDIMYAETLLNYDFLNIQRVDNPGTDYDYLIVTTQDFFSPLPNSPYQRLKTHIEVERDFEVYELIYPDRQTDWLDVYNDIRDIYINTGETLDYILLIGDNEDIPTIYKPNTPPWQENWLYTDFYYQCIIGGSEEEPWDDLMPECHLGRLAVDRNTDDLAHIIDKIIYYDTEEEGGEWQEKDLMVAWGHFGYLNQLCMRVTDRIIEDYPLPESPIPRPDYIKCYGYIGSIYYGTNDTVKNWINDGVAIVSYLGHGNTDCWTAWYDLPGGGDGSFWNSDVYDLTNEHYPVVFNSCCETGMIWDEPEYDCMCEAWLCKENAGAVATYGATRDGGTESKIFEAMFKSIYAPKTTHIDETKFPIIGPVFTTSLVNEPFCHYFLLFGEPSMTIKIYLGGSSMSGETSTSLSDLTDTSFSLKSIYPNPISGNSIKTLISSNNETTLMITIYDITGRKIKSKTYSLKKDDNEINVDISSLTNGVYILRAENEDNSETRKFVFAR